MANQTLIQKLSEGLERLGGLFQKELLSRQAWGEITFNEAKADLDRAKNIVGYLRLLPLENLPDNACTSITQAISQLETHVKQIDEFTILAGNPESASKNIINALHPQVDQFYTTTAQWIPFLAYQKGDVAENISQLTLSVQQAKEMILTAQKEATAGKEELGRIIVAAREASASAGAAVFTADFEEEYKKHSKSSIYWLIASIVCIVATVITSFCFWWVALEYPKADSLQVAQVIVSKLIILSMLVTASVWCGKNYRILQHLATLNKHRSLSIRTLQAFVAAASDAQTKNAVLLEANRAVFSSGGTGYLDGSNDKDSPITIVELAKDLGKTK